MLASRTLTDKFTTLLRARHQSRSHRFWLLMGAVSLFVIGSMTGASHVGPAGEVAATKFKLLDKKGELRASLEVGDLGEPAFRLVDSRGHTRLLVGLTADDSASIIMMDEDGKPKIIASSPSGEGTPLIQVRDKDQRSAIGLLVPRDRKKKEGGFPTLSVWGEDRNPHVNLTLRPDYSGSMVFTDKSNLQRLNLDLDKNGRAKLDILDAQGASLIGVPKR
jgi:hypothetical protein